MKKRMFLSFVVMVLAMTVMFSATVFANDGRITVRVNDTPVVAGAPGDRAALELLISQAETLLVQTPHTAERSNSSSVPTGEWAAPQAARTVFQNAIDAAKAALVVNTFAQGNTFTITVGIEENAGFAGMIVQLGFPAGLTVIDFEDFDNISTRPTFAESFRVPFNTDVHGGRVGDIVPRPGPNGSNFYHAGWAGRTAPFTYEGDLFSYVVRVDAASGTSLAPITIALANAIPPEFYELPSDIYSEPLHMLLPCGTLVDETEIVADLAWIRVS